VGSANMTRQICKIGNETLNENKFLYIIGMKPTKSKKRTRKRIRIRTRRGGVHLDLIKSIYLIDEAKRHEPVITNHLESFARITGIELLPDDGNRIKSLESILKKTNSPKKKVPRDILRYTFILPSKNFKNSVLLTLEQMDSYRFIYHPEHSKNYFCRNNIYKGLNQTFEYDNYIFEVQFHTPDSFRIKSEMHDNYDKFRTTSDPEQKCILYKLMEEANDKIRINYDSKCLHIESPCHVGKENEDEDEEPKAGERKE
jgi:hypothetical protein